MRPSKPISCVTITHKIIYSNKGRNQYSLAKNQLARRVPNFIDLKKETKNRSLGKSSFSLLQFIEILDLFLIHNTK